MAGPRQRRDGRKPARERRQMRARAALLPRCPRCGTPRRRRALPLGHRDRPALGDGHGVPGRRMPHPQGQRSLLPTSPPSSTWRATCCGAHPARTACASSASSPPGTTITSPPSLPGNNLHPIPLHHARVVHAAGRLQAGDGISPLKAPSASSGATCHPPASAPTPRSNRGSVRCAVGAPLTAISSLGAFRTLAVGARGWGRHAGVRKPAQVLP